jgi:membrane protein YqaA with SNARE-associated domain
MTTLLHRLYDLLVAFGPVGVFLLSIIDSMGVPLPAAMDALVLGVAAGSVNEPSHAYLTAFVAVLGSAGGNIFLFHAARQGGRFFRQPEPQPGKRRRFREWFGRYGLVTVFVPAVTPIVPLPLKVFAISAGALRTSFVKFVGVILTARVIRYFGLAYLGLQLGADAEGFLRRNGWTFAGTAVLAAAAIYLAVRYYGGRRSAASGAATIE